MDITISFWLGTVVRIDAGCFGFASLAHPSSRALAHGFLVVTDASTAVPAEIGTLIDFTFVACVSGSALALGYSQLIHGTNAL